MGITLYSTGCPRCHILEKKLNEKNVSYVVETNVDKMLEMGFTEVPVLVVEEKQLSYLEAVNWIKETF